MEDLASSVSPVIHKARCQTSKEHLRWLQNSNYSNRKQCSTYKGRKIEWLALFFFFFEESNLECWEKRQVKVTENCVENTDFAYMATSRPGHMPRQLPAPLSGIRSIGMTVNYCWKSHNSRSGSFSTVFMWRDLKLLLSSNSKGSSLQFKLNAHEEDDAPVYCKTSLEFLLMRRVRIRHSSHEFATQSSHSVDLAGWHAKMASIEIWIPWCNAHRPHWCMISSLDVGRTLARIYCYYTPAVPLSVKIFQKKKKFWLGAKLSKV